MSIWFYVAIIASIVILGLMIKIYLMKKEINNIGKSLSVILKSDTNNLITVNSNERELKNLAHILNNSLKELRKLELEYKQGNQELKSSITNISHDLRTPLAAIRGYLDLTENGQNIEEQTKYLRIIDEKVTDLTELTEQLFDFSKSLDIQNEVKREEICVNDILENSILSFYGMFKKYNISPQIDICEEKIIRVLNENMLKRIFENIISNAIKYSEKDFYVRLEKSGRITFSNKTTLLDSASLDKIFNRYYTIKNTKKSNGIGLSIAKQLVELNEGIIKAKYNNGYLVIELEF